MKLTDGTFYIQCLKLAIYPLEEASPALWLVYSHSKGQPLGVCCFGFLVLHLKNLFLAALGLTGFVRAFSGCSEWGATLRCGTLASHFGGTSRYKVQALGTQAK